MSLTLPSLIYSTNLLTLKHSQSNRQWLQHCKGIVTVGTCVNAAKEMGGKPCSSSVLRDDTAGAYYLSLPTYREKCQMVNRLYFKTRLGQVSSAKPKLHLHTWSNIYTVHGERSLEIQSEATVSEVGCCQTGLVVAECVSFDWRCLHWHLAPPSNHYVSFPHMRTGRGGENDISETPFSPGCQIIFQLQKIQFTFLRQLQMNIQSLFCFSKAISYTMPFFHFRDIFTELINRRHNVCCKIFHEFSHFSTWFSYPRREIITQLWIPRGQLRSHHPLGAQ